MKEVKGPGDVPDGPHYAILVYKVERVTEYTGYEDDPKYSHLLHHRREIPTFTHLVTVFRDEWVKEIGRLEGLAFRDHPYVALKVAGRAKVVKTFDVEVT